MVVADAFDGVTDLLDRLIAVQLQKEDPVHAKARLKRAAFTFLLGLDKNEEVSFSSSYNRKIEFSACHFRHFERVVCIDVNAKLYKKMFIIFYPMQLLQHAC